MSTASPEPLSSGEEGDEDAEVRVDAELREKSDQELKDKLQRIEYGLKAFSTRDGGKKYCLLRDSINRELSRREAARSVPASAQPPRPPRPLGRQGQPVRHLPVLYLLYWCGAASVNVRSLPLFCRIWDGSV
jgi:hypothetical protein